MTQGFRLALLLIAGLTLIRVAALAMGGLDLGGDEAQYWAWGEEPAFGYFSKPPLIAWLIAATTGLLGDSELAVRVSAPFLHAGTALVLFVLARRLYDMRTALWSALVFATLPAVSFSSGFMSTDVPLLFFWALALLGLVYALDRPTPVLAGLTGAAIGFGLLAKYAMIYFPVSAGLALIVVPRLRPVLLGPFGLIAGLTALLVFSPNLAWNAAHGFPTFAHTASNADLDGALFNPGALAEFLGAQFGVFGPLLFATLAIGTARMAVAARRGAKPDEATRLLLAFALPVLVIACAIAFLSRANANWAAPAYVAATPLVVRWLIEAGRRRLFGLSMQLHTVAAFAIAAGIAFPALADGLGLSNALKRVRGWEVTGSHIARRAAHEPYTAILADDRELMGALLFYAQPRAVPVVMWDWSWHPRNHYELFHRIDAQTGARVLYVSLTEAPDHVLSRFALALPLAPLTVRIDATRIRTLYLYDLAGFRPTAPAG